MKDVFKNVDNMINAIRKIKKMGPSKHRVRLSKSHTKKEELEPNDEARETTFTTFDSNADD
jgi:hypothetical protein